MWWHGVRGESKIEIDGVFYGVQSSLVCPLPNQSTLQNMTAYRYDGVAVPLN